MDTFSLISCSFIFVVFVTCWIFIIRLNNDRLPKQRRWIEQLPSIISTLGVLGTFLGITKGLLAFDAFDLDRSIPLLLNGLRTAFFTSLTGISCSLILTRVVALKFQSDTNESEVSKAAHEIIDELIQWKSVLPAMLEKQDRLLIGELKEYLASLDQMSKDIVQLKDDVEEMNGYAQEFMEDRGKLKETKSEAFNRLNDILSKTNALIATQTANLAAIDVTLQQFANSKKK